METPHTETVIEKTIAYVKDVLGIQTAPEADLEYHDTAPEVTAENAMRLDPNEFAVGELNAEGYFPSTESATSTRETDIERLRREVDEHPREKSALELNAESARAEDGE